MGRRIAAALATKLDLRPPILQAGRLVLSTASKIAIARALYRMVRIARRPFGGQDLVVVRRHGIVWHLDLREGIDLTIYLAGAFERDTLRSLESLVRPGATVLDVGANVGAHTLHLARLVGEGGRVLAFEPTDFAVDKLRTNLRANPALEKRVTVHHVFLVAEPGAPVRATVSSSWPVDGTRPDDAQMGSRAMGVGGAIATTLDDVLEAAGRPTIQLIKMDVDGHELEVLKGARRLLSASAPPIVMELAPYVFNPPEKFDELVALLLGLGYTFLRFGSSRPLPRDSRALRVRIPHEGSINVLAAPSSRSLGGRSFGHRK